MSIYSCTVLTFVLKISQKKIKPSYRQCINNPSETLEAVDLFVLHLFTCIHDFPSSPPFLFPSPLPLPLPLPPPPFPFPSPLSRGLES
ncbi:unnamed protein product [Boreogadus saida]